MGALPSHDVVCDLRFQRRIDGLAEMMAQQHIFGGDGVVGFELEYPMAIRLLQSEQRIGCRGNALVERAAGSRGGLVG